MERIPNSSAPSAESRGARLVELVSKAAHLYAWEHRVEVLREFPAESQFSTLPPLKPTQKKILRFLSSVRHAKPGKIASAVNVAPGTSRLNLKPLVEWGLVSESGNSRGKSYTITRKGNRT